MAMLDDHHVVVMGVPTVVAMHFGTRAETAMMVAVPDHNGLGAGNRRGCDGNGGQCGNHISKLLHSVLLVRAKIKLRIRVNVPEKAKENSERLFRQDQLTQRALLSR
jgi:hypothetical protein